MPDIRLIKTEADYEAAMSQIEEFFADMPDPGTPEGDHFELLTVLVARYEEQHHPIPMADPIDLIWFAIEDLGRSQTELADLLGSRPRASEILNRKRPLTLSMIREISVAWKLPLEALAVPYALVGVEA